MKNQKDFNCSSVQDGLNKLYSQLYGSITIPSGIIEQEELDVSMQMCNLGFYDEFKYVDYENSNN